VERDVEHGLPLPGGFDADEIEAPTLRDENSEAHEPHPSGEIYGESVRLDGTRARERFGNARVARLATASADAQPHAVPIVFALVGDVLYTAIDWKPKTTRTLRRLANIAANPRVAVLVDHYEDDWTHLWWARADGTARIAVGDEENAALRLLSERYPAYDSRPPPGPVIAVDVARWSGWQAAAE
jgi:PPOX class probable F420-dependent enzyme